MANYREIVTKTVIGKGKKTFIDKGYIKPNNSPSTILGCWIINHNFGGSKSGDNISINGSYDLNIWYSFDNNSKTDVIKQNVTYNEVVHIRNKNDTDEQEVIVRSLKQPSCSKVDIEDGKINYMIEKEISETYYFNPDDFNEKGRRERRSNRAKNIY